MERLDVGQSDQGTELKPYHPKQLGSKHKIAISLIAMGLDQKQVADMVGMSYSYISSLKSHPQAELIQSQTTAELVSKITNDVGDIIQAHAKESILRIAELMRYAENENVALRAAIEMKNTAGYKPVERAVSASVTMSEDTAKLFAQAAREARGEVEDLEPVDDSAGALGIEVEEEF